MHKLWDLQEGCTFKGLLHETMNLTSWCYIMKGPNLHVVQVHHGKNPMVLHASIYQAYHLIK